MPQKIDIGPIVKIVKSDDEWKKLWRRRRTKC